jgi:hypothetical protein
MGVSLCQSLQANNSLSHLSLFQTIQGKKYFIANISFTHAPSSIEKLVMTYDSVVDESQLWMNPFSSLSLSLSNHPKKEVVHCQYFIH